MKNILECLEYQEKKVPDKIAFADEKESITYSELLDYSRKIGSCLLKLNTTNKPIAIYLDKSVNVISAMMGIVYSGNFYVVIDSEMPVDRIKRIFSSLNPVAIITDSKYSSNLDGYISFDMEECKAYNIDEEGLKTVRANQIDTDPIYALYTSGSTGMPKGAIINHRNVLAYSEWAVSTFGIHENTVFGNQTPFYFSMSVTDIYATIRAGATLVIIPKLYFSFPIKLIEFLNERKINTIYWVPSAIGIVSNYKVFEIEKPKYLKTVLFAGEVMPTKQLNYWIQHLDEDVVFANLYGPTEATDICTYYVVNRKFQDDEPLPIGNHCDNCNVFVVNEQGKLAGRDEQGELYIRGSFLSPGYYNNPQKTSEAFVQNPLHSAYPEICYKTGDLVRVNEYGEMMYVCRKDYQIKHMGYRIELGEIEAAVSSIEGIKENACVYDDMNDKIVLFYSSSRLKEDTLIEKLKEKLNHYMLPNKLIKQPNLPRNQNGKIDRKKLKECILQ